LQDAHDLHVRRLAAGTSEVEPVLDRTAVLLLDRGEVRRRARDLLTAVLAALGCCAGHGICLLRGRTTMQTGSGARCDRSRFPSGVATPVRIVAMPEHQSQVHAPAGESFDDAGFRDELPEDLQPSGYVGPYIFPTNDRRRIPGYL